MKKRAGIVLAWVLVACGSTENPRTNEPGTTGSASVASASAAPSTSASAQASASSAPVASASAPKPEGDCPDDMILVDTSFCPNVTRSCLKDEYTKANKITICHKFAEKAPKCNGGERRQRFCIDKYEYPNKEGAKPPVMVDWHDAMAICKGEGKRLCFESEWTAACEGPEKLPFPYGYTRDPSKCNINNPYIEPSLDKMYSKNPAIFGPELEHLDQGVPSGSRPGCVSGFGVHDQPGNVDEWVILDTPRGKGDWAGLKGGAWGYVRNACRPVTTSHAAEFTYYFVSFRCCADAKPGGAADPAPWAHPALPKVRKTPETANRGYTPEP